jgi:hypothetical protein
VLRALEATCLTPNAVTAIVHKAIVMMRPADGTAVPRRAALRADLAVIEARIAELIAAVGRAPDLDSLLAALRTQEQCRAALRAELNTLDGLERVGTLDPAAVTPIILEKLGGFTGLLTRRVDEARAILRRLLQGRIRFVPQPDGVMEFVGYASLEPLFTGTVAIDVGKAAQSSRGHEPLCDAATHWRTKSIQYVLGAV